MAILRWPFVVVVAIAFAFAAIARADSLDDGQPIQVFDELGLARTNELVKVLIPAAANAAVLAVGELRVTDPAGAEVPVQWRVLARWAGAPQDPAKPIRFALAQFLVDLEPGETRTYTVARRLPEQGPPAQPENPMRVQLNGSFVSVITGPLRVDFSPLCNTLFQGVLLDADGDGIFENESTEVVCNPWTSLGPILVDRFGSAYLAAIQPGPTLTVEEWGPLLLTLRLDGQHLPLPGTGIGRDFFTYTTRYHFAAGSTTVRVEHSLKNTYLQQPLGAIGFARYMLHLQFAATGPLDVTFGGEMSGAGSLHAAPGLGEEAVLYQDAPGDGLLDEALANFHGWRLWSNPAGAPAPESPPQSPPLATGERADGFLHVRDDVKGMLVALRNPWQNYPYALRALGNGMVLLDLFPAEQIGLHWLDDAQKKTFELDFDFHSHSEEYDARAQARRITEPLRPVLPLDYWRETKAWGDIGDLRDPGLGFAAMQADAANDLATLHALTGPAGGYGAFDFGEPVWAKSTHTTGSPRNRLSFFDRFIISGARDAFVKNEVFALHSMDVRPYHIDGFVAAEHPDCMLIEGIPAWPTEDWLGRDQLDPALDPHRAGIPPNGHGWNGYDAEHMVVDDLYEYYLLTGSWNARDALVRIGQGILSLKFLAPNAPIGSSRVAGWCLRALAKIWSVTGDPAVLQRAQEIVASVERFRGKLPSPVTGLVYHYLSRVIYAKVQHNMTEDYDLPWQMAVGIYGLACYGTTTGDAAAEAAIQEIAGYIAHYCVQDGIVVDALAWNDHLDFNPSRDNQGTNAWIPSALAIAWRLSGDPELKSLAEALFDQNDTDFVTSNDFYHWYHSAGEVLGK